MSQCKKCFACLCFSFPFFSCPFRFFSFSVKTVQATVHPNAMVYDFLAIYNSRIWNMAKLDETTINFHPWMQQTVFFSPHSNGVGLCTWMTLADCCSANQRYLWAEKRKIFHHFNACYPMIRNGASVLNMNGGTIIFKIVNQINDIHTVSEWMFYEALCKYVCGCLCVVPMFSFRSRQRAKLLCSKW